MTRVINASPGQLIHYHEGSYEHPSRRNRRRSGIAVEHRVLLFLQDRDVELLFGTVGDEPVLDEYQQLAGAPRLLFELHALEVGRPCSIGYIVKTEIRSNTNHVLQHGLRRRHTKSLLVLLVGRERLAQRNHGIVVLAGRPLQHPRDVLHRRRAGEASTWVVVRIPAKQGIRLTSLHKRFLHVPEPQIIHHAVIVDHRPLQSGRIVIQHVVAHDECCDVLCDALGVALFRQSLGLLQRDIACRKPTEPAQEESRAELADQRVLRTALQQRTERARIAQRHVMPQRGIVRRKGTAKER